MLKSFKIDGLLVFFVLSISLLCISWKYGLILLTEENPIEYHKEFDFYKNAEIIHDNTGNVQSVLVLNPSLSIFYSINGGDSFVEVGQELRFTAVENPNITNIPVAWKWRAPAWNLPTIKNAKVVLVNSSKISRSQVVSLNSLFKADTSIPLISLSLKQSQFIGETNGLYALGQNAWHDDAFVKAWWYRPANFTQRGSDWEKSVDFSYYEKGQLKINQKCGLKISGNATRGFSQKSFKLYARKIYSEEEMEYSFFGTEGLTKYESLVIRSSGNDNTRTLFADMMMQQIASKSDLYIQKGVATQLFINGSYWGIYNLRERISIYNLAEYSGEKYKKITILEDGNAELKDGMEEHYNEFHTLVDEVFGSAVVDDKLLTKVEQDLSLSSFQDYIFFETFFANNDWPENNSMCYKANKNKWRWILNDLDYSLAYPGVDNVDKNMFQKLEESEAIFARLFISLLTNSEFKRSFIERSKLNLNNIIEDKAVQIFHSQREKIKKIIPNQIKRWRSISSVTDWETHCQNNLDFLRNRPSIYHEQLLEL